MDKQYQKNRKEDSMKQGNQTKKENDSHRSSASQCKDSTEESDSKN